MEVSGRNGTLPSMPMASNSGLNDGAHKLPGGSGPGSSEDSLAGEVGRLAEENARYRQKLADLMGKSTAGPPPKAASSSHLIGSAERVSFFSQSQYIDKALRSRFKAIQAATTVIPLSISHQDHARSEMSVGITQYSNKQEHMHAQMLLSSTTPYVIQQRRQQCVGIVCRVQGGPEPPSFHLFDCQQKSAIAHVIHTLNLS